MKPLNQPTAAARRNAAPIAQPMLMPVPMNVRDIRPIVIALAPVMTPDDRSNSPPIISRATAVAMMPVGAATSSQLSVELAWPNVRAFPQKKIHTMTAPMSAPISGEISQRCIGPRCDDPLVGVHDR